MLDVEAALGGRPMRAQEIDIAQLGRDGAEHASPVVPLAKLFPDTHAGATSQDILDTAMMLVIKRALGPLLTEADAASDCRRPAGHTATLNAGHGTNPAPGRRPDLVRPARPRAG